MSSHGDISADLSAYLDGELGSKAADQVDRAVTASAEIATQLHDLRRLRTILRALEPVRPGADFVARVIAEARRRGLMRRVVRERMIGGVLRLASAAAAVMLIATIGGILYQSLTLPGPADGPGPNAPPAVASVTREEDDSARTGRAKPSATPEGTWDFHGNAGTLAGIDKPGRASDTGGRYTLELAVEDLGAGAKEVTAALTELGLARTDLDDGAVLATRAYGKSRFRSVPSAAKVRGEPAPAAEVAAGDRPDEKTGIIRGSDPARPVGKPTAKAALAPTDRAGFVRIPADEDEVRFRVVAPRERIEALSRRLGNLRGRQTGTLPGCETCFSAPSTQYAKALKAPEPSAPAAAGENATKGETAKPADPNGRHWLAAELHRIGNDKNDSSTGRERGLGQGVRNQPAASAPAVQAPAPAPRNDLLIITIRRRPPDNQADPGRNTTGP